MVFLTNMEKRDKFLILRAAQMTAGFENKIVVKDEAFDSCNRLLEGCMAVFSKLGFDKDHSPFWEKFRSLQSLGQEAEDSEEGAIIMKNNACGAHGQCPSNGP